MGGRPGEKSRLKFIHHACPSGVPLKLLASRINGLKLIFIIYSLKALSNRLKQL
jgi:hypothetical protein